MSAIEEFARFMAGIAPSLVELGKELFSTSGGNVDTAKRDIESRVEELRKGRAAVDAAADEKFGG